MAGSLAVSAPAVRAPSSVVAYKLVSLTPPSGRWRDVANVC